MLAKTIGIIDVKSEPLLLVIPCWHRNGLARTDSVLAYSHRGWHRPAGEPMLARDRHQDGQRDGP